MASGNFKGKALFGWSRWKNERSPNFFLLIFGWIYDMHMMLHMSNLEIEILA
jgi:hypothetical protein